MNFVRVAWALAVGALLAGCSSESTNVPPAPVAETKPQVSASVASESGPHQDVPKIVILGDSLTAGLGLDTEQSYVSLLQRRLDQQGLKYQMVNAGVSGDTSTGGLQRLEWALEGDVRVLVVALGANDGLRGVPVTVLRRNLSATIRRGQAKGATVILAGMEALPNYGPEYTSAFRQTYRDLAREYNVALIPFLLDGVAGVPELNQRDGIHPNAEGARIVERTVWAALAPVLERVRQ